MQTSPLAAITTTVCSSPQLTSLTTPVSPPRRLTGVSVPTAAAAIFPGVIGGGSSLKVAVPNPGVGLYTARRRKAS